MSEFIAHDWCGWNDQYGRYTHIPSGDTLVCRPYMGQTDWDKAQLDYFLTYPGLNVHECPGRYTTEGTKIIGTTEYLCDWLRKRLVP